MAWNGTVTNLGIELLQQWTTSGATLVIDGAKTGEGTVPVAQLMGQSDVAGTSHSAGIADKSIGDGQVVFNVQIQAAAAAYTAMQIGIFAHVGNNSSMLLALFQAEEGSGISIYSASEMPEFSTIFAAIVQMATDGDLEVTIDSNLLVNRGQLSAAVADLEGQIEDMTAVPFIRTIPTGYWSGSSGNYYITIQASNVTADSMLKLFWDKTASDMLNGPVWCTHSAGQIQIHTSAIPAGTVTIGVELIGTVGEAQYIDLPDVYSKSQVDLKIQQSTANLLSGLFGNLAHETINITSTVTLDQILDSTIQNVSAEKTYGIDVRATMAESPGANRNLILMWSNATRKFAFALIINFNGLWYAKRGNTDTFAVTRVV